MRDAPCVTSLCVWTGAPGQMNTAQYRHVQGLLGVSFCLKDHLPSRLIKGDRERLRQKLIHRMERSRLTGQLQKNPEQVFRVLH